MKKNYEIYTSDGFKINHYVTEERMYELSLATNVVMIKEIHYTKKGKLKEKTVYLSQ